MDINTAIDNILRNYGELAAADRPQLEKMFDSGLERGGYMKDTHIHY